MALEVLWESVLPVEVVAVIFQVSGVTVSRSFTHHFCFGSQSRCAEPEDRQEEHLSADLLDVVSWIWEAYNLLPTPSEAWKIFGFHVGVDLVDQLSSLYHLPTGNSSDNILVDIDDCIS